MEEVVSMNVDFEDRLVHLDLKGAPPKLSYYEWLFPLLSKWGATGLLVEYEDMFPYSGELSVIASVNAYSPSDLERLLALARLNKLEVVPLVQTFGHFEFVLKHDQFRHLREVESCPMTVCPSVDGSFDLIKEMVYQVIRLHPGIKVFHIGADEVYHVGLCDKCVGSSSKSPGAGGQVQLYFAHVLRVLQYVKTERSDIRLVMWDDMFRSVDLAQLQDSGIGKLVEPMVWCYHRQIKLPVEMWTRYSKVFPGVWAAGAFKGATGSSMAATDIGYHVENQKEWLAVANSCVKPLFPKFYGFALTGWQRYDHYAVLCELLPVGMPSLAICLLTITAGAFTVDVHQQATKDLGFNQLIPMNPFVSSVEESACQHIGSDVFRTVHSLLLLKAECKFFFKNDRLKGWMTDWHLRNNYTNPVHVAHFLPHGQKLLESFEQLSENLSTALSEIFYPDAVDEWMSVNVLPTLTKLRRIVSKANDQIAIGGRSKNAALSES